VGLNTVPVGVLVAVGDDVALGCAVRVTVGAALAAGVAVGLTTVPIGVLVAVGVAWVPPPLPAQPAKTSMSGAQNANHACRIWSMILPPWSRRRCM
jgi:hypothetical protein